MNLLPATDPFVVLSLELLEVGVRSGETEVEQIVAGVLFEFLGLCLGHLCSARQDEIDIRIRHLALRAAEDTIRAEAHHLLQLLRIHSLLGIVQTTLPEGERQKTGT